MSKNRDQVKNDQLDIKIFYNIPEEFSIEMAKLSKRQIKTPGIPKATKRDDPRQMKIDSFIIHKSRNMAHSNPYLEDDSIKTN